VRQARTCIGRNRLELRVLAQHYGLPANPVQTAAGLAIGDATQPVAEGTADLSEDMCGAGEWHAANEMHTQGLVSR
jgi:hypothetical protein